MQAASPQACRKMLHRFTAELERDCRKLSGMSCIAVFSHGDFHGGNLVPGRGVSYGLDFTEACTKLAVYDIADFLKMNVFLPAEPSEVGACGIRNHSKEMFFKKYRQKVNSGFLTSALRGRLLIELAKISREAFERSAFMRKKFAFLERRLSIAFAQPLEG